VRLHLVPLATLTALIVGGWCSPAEAAPSGPQCGGQITIVGPGYAIPYPSTCEIAGRTGTITDVDLQILSLTHTWPDDIDMLLVGPGGENAIVMSDAGGSFDMNSVDLALDDAADMPLPDGARIQDGTYQPANYQGVDFFGPEAPPPSGASELAVFNGTDPNGTWRLFIVDDRGLDDGHLLDWGLTITTSINPPPPPPVPPPPSPPPPPWQIRAPLPIDLYGGAAVSDGTYAYVVGGDSSNNLFRFDPASNTWTTLAPMPVTVFMPSAVYYPPTNRIYVFGGQNVASVTSTRATRIYDIGSDSWSTGANMPATRSFMASAYNEANGWIYLVGGFSTRQFSSVQNQVWAYNPIVNTFDTNSAPIPHAVGGAASGIVTSPTPRMYVIGGRDASTVLALNWEFDFGAHRWAPRAPAPQPTNVPGGGAYGGRMHVFGGDNPFLTPFSSSNTWSYDPVLNTWFTGSPMNVARSFVASTFVGGTAIAAGGLAAGEPTDVTETTEPFGPPSTTEAGN
jgi:Kelch motif/Galactose oxidase, central domain